MLGRWSGLGGGRDERRRRPPARVRGFPQPMPRPVRMAPRRAGRSVRPMTTSPLRVLVAGGGVAGIEALLTLHALAGDRVDLTLADAQADFVYRPMKVAEPFARGLARRYPIADMARDAGARLVADAVGAVDPVERIARTAGGEALRYDALLLATGAQSVPAFEHALTWDDRSGPDHLGGLLRDIEQGYVRRLAFVVPPGPGWPLPAYELALMTARMAWDAQTGPQITLVTPEVAPARDLRTARDRGGEGRARGGRRRLPRRLVRRDREGPRRHGRRAPGHAPHRGRPRRRAAPARRAGAVRRPGGRGRVRRTSTRTARSRALDTSGPPATASPSR